MLKTFSIIISVSGGICAIPTRINEID
jgi:hypothetical protein